MVVDLAPDQEEFLLQRVRSGRFADVNEAVREAVCLLREREADTGVKRADQKKILAQPSAESPFRGTDIEFERDPRSPLGQTGAELAAAMQAMPYPDVDIEPSRPHLRLRDVDL